MVGVLFSFPVVAAECENEVVARWRSEFGDDPAFSGLFLAADGRSAAVRFVGEQKNFDRLVPHARSVLSNIIQPVHIDGRIDTVSMFGATIYPVRADFALLELK